MLLSTLFAYLADGIEEAQTICGRHIERIPSGSYAAEQSYQILCKLVHIHCSRHSAPASLARHTLEIAIAAHPNNTIFLSLYLWGETGGRVYGRVQRLIAHLSSASKDTAGVVGHLWSVWAEAMTAHRTFWDKSGRGAERVRRALDKGINSPV